MCDYRERNQTVWQSRAIFPHDFSSSQCAVHSVAMVTNRILGRRRSSESRAKVVDKADRVTLQRHSCSSRLQRKETHGRVPSDIRKVSSDKRSPPDTGARCSPWRVPTCAAHAGALSRSAWQLSCARPAFPELLAAGSNFPIPNCPWNFQPLQKYQFLSQLRSSVPVAQRTWRCNLHSQVQLPRALNFEVEIVTAAERCAKWKCRPFRGERAGENWKFLFTDILAGFTVNNRVLRLPAIVLLNTTFQPGLPAIVLLNTTFRPGVSGLKRRVQ